MLKGLIRKRMNDAIREEVFPGCVVGFVRKSGERLVLPIGHFTYEQGTKKVEKDSIFDVASITKSIPTSCLALKLIDEGKLKVDDKLIEFVPEFRNSDKELVYIKHLLTQTLNFQSLNNHFRLSNYKDKSPDEILEAIFTAEFGSKPGARFAYTNATSILLGLVVERISRKKLDEFGQEAFFKPLKMMRTSFHPEQFDKEEIVPTEFDEWRGRLAQGEVHDESAYTLMEKQVVGSAGLFSTAPDLLNFF